ncbi:MAG: radical SAM protein [Candidatus Parabeggiatoa sp. nov. 2]|nr:MAG: radical SAM protein [Gammaproteobacteria bacterium]
MKILQVIHGYPMRYNAGSEVYTQTLCHGLAARHQVHVFTRQEEPFAPDYAYCEEVDPDEPRVTLHLVNLPRSRDRYRHQGIDQRFAERLERIKPDIVHIGHLNHLSTSIVTEAAYREIPIVYTLHDYWIMCPRGQFMQMHPNDQNDLWAACDGQQDRKCAQRCYARYFSGAPVEQEEDITYWTSWVKRRMQHIREMVELIDLFIAPSRYLYNRYHEEFGLPTRKLVYLDYGFDRKRLRHRQRIAGEPFTFGYIGTHIPAKGIHHLIEAFAQVSGKARLRIWGRLRGENSKSLQDLANSLPDAIREQIEWLPEYRNQNIVTDVFNRVDAIVVPSIWVENSPLVIHEALQARVPVITADVGGMCEYIHHEVNGLLFQHRHPEALAVQMQRLIDNPTLAKRLGQRGYIQSETGDIPNLSEQVSEVERLYNSVIQHRNSTQITPLKGPWRITFDTNPDDCNLRCVMCEEHSQYSPRKKERRTEGMSHRKMPIELIRRVLENAQGTGLKEIIPSTMGEPLLYEHFDDIINWCHQFGVQLNLTTNGTFPKKGPQAWAERIVPVTSDVKISLNGASQATQEKIMVGSRWEKMLNNMTTFIDVRNAHAAKGGNYCRVTFQLTFLEWNVAELADIVRLAARFGVDRVKGHHVWAHFDELKPLSMRRSPEAIARWNQAVLAARAAAQTAKLPNGKSVLLENIDLLNDTAVEDMAPGGQCPFLGKEAWINTEGRFSPCCAPDEQRRCLGEFGYVTEMTLQEIWQSKTYQQLVRTYRNHSLCLSCNMRTPLTV